MRSREVRPIRLNVGEQVSISAQNVRSYSEGVAGIVDVRLPRDGSQFVIVALQPGATTLLLILLDGRHLLYQITVEGDASVGESSVAPQDNIRLHFYFVQLSHSYSHQLGIAWPGVIGGGTFSATFNALAGSFSSATAVVADQVLPRLDLAQTSGWARVMRQAALITANGQEATFTSGGEVNVPVQGALTAGIEKIAFGSEIVVRPRYDRNTGRLEISLRADVSDLTEARGGGIPGRTVSTLNTTVNLELDQALILAGLTSRTERSTQGGIPGLSQIPILGGIFGSNSKQQEAIENLVFIVPTVVDAVPRDAMERVRDAWRTYEEYSGDLDGVRLVGPGPLGQGSAP